MPPTTSRGASAYLRHHFENVEQQADAAGFAMWLFLLTEVMFLRRNVHRVSHLPQLYYPGIRRGLAPVEYFLGTLNTLSSSRRASPWPWAYGARKPASKRTGVCLVLTFILGLGFLGIKSIEYGEKIEKHHVPASTTVCSRSPIRHPILKSSRSTTTSR